MSNDGAISIHGIFAAIVKGRQDRGDDGILYVKGEMCAYLKPNEFPDANMCAMAKQLLEMEQSAHVFWVMEERDGRGHVGAYPREKVYHMLSQRTSPQQPEGGGSSKDDSTNTGTRA